MYTDLILSCMDVFGDFFIHITSLNIYIRLYNILAMSPHTLPYTNTRTQYNRCQLNDWRAFLGYPPLHIALHLLLLPLQTVFAAPNFVYPMHFTCCSVQWHLMNFRTKYSQFVLIDSTGDEVWSRIWARF